MQKQKSLSNFVAIIAIVSMLFIAGCIQPPINAQAKELPKFSSCEAIKGEFEKAQQQGYYRGGILEKALGVTGAQAAEQAADGSAPTPTYSETNVQVQGVDEADIVKTDGKFIYTVSNNRLNIVEAYPAGEAKLVSSTDLKNVYPQEIFIQANIVLVFGSTYQEVALPPQPLAAEGEGSSGSAEGESIIDTITNAAEKIASPTIVGEYYYPYYSKQIAAVLMFDVSDKENPKLERSLEFEGSYLSSRKIADKVYFVINSYPNYYALAENAKPEDVIPTYRERNSGEIIQENIERASTDLRPIAPCSEIAYFPPLQAQSFMTLASVSMNNIGSEVEKQTIVGSGQNVYASPKNWYVAEVQYNYGILPLGVGIATRIASTSTVEPATATQTEPASDETTTIGSNEETTVEEQNPDETIVEPEPVPLPSPIPDIFPIEPTEKTIVHKFSLNDGKIEYLGNFEAKGTILNQFSMDEFNDNFRIATTIHRWSNEGRNVSSNNVYVFNPDLKQVGSLEELAPGETIYSVRFAGERGYIVTFKKVDPFFVIDLSSPENPKVLGNLKIPGYSNYLHPIDATHIIGVGKEAEASKQGDFAWYLGMKLAVFDVTNPENPVQMHSITIGDRGTDSAALYDHKAFLYDKEKNLLVIPIALYEIDDSIKNQYDSLPFDWPQYGVFKFQGAYVFDLSLENGFDLKGRITHNTDEDLLKMGYYYYGYGKEVRRSLYIDNVLYTISDAMIKANDLGSLEELKSIELPFPEPVYYPYAETVAIR